jgi:hypothetical protein
VPASLLEESQVKNYFLLFVLAVLIVLTGVTLRKTFAVTNASPAQHVSNAVAIGTEPVPPWPKKLAIGTEPVPPWPKKLAIGTEPVPPWPKKLAIGTEPVPPWPKRSVNASDAR